MRRKVYNDLLKWKKDTNKKPLLVIGARQVGKTYIIDEFCRNEFERYVVINLLERTDIIDLYKSRENSEDKYRKLKAMLGIDLDESTTVLFVDEVQESEEFISNLKFFNEKHPNVNIICAGSLLGVKLKRFSASFPVGKVKMIDMYPMDFEEFLMAFAQDFLIGEIRNSFANNQRLDSPFHEMATDFYRLFLCIGGMPEAVKDIVRVDRDIVKHDRSIIQAIIDSYFADMKRYVVSNSEALKIEKIYNSIPYQLSNKSGKFQYSKLADRGKSRDFESPLAWLTSSRLIIKSDLVTLPDIPLKGFVKHDYFKLFISDLGILTHMLGINFGDILTDKLRTYKGELTENYVATELNANGIPLFYWKSERAAEVDFLLYTDAGIVPVEVKAGVDVRSKSLLVYIENFKPIYSIRISMRNFGFENGIKSVPLYAVFCIR